MSKPVTDNQVPLHQVPLAPGDETRPANYQADFYSWLIAQARHLRAGRWNALDRENLAEEIE